MTGRIDLTAAPGAAITALIRRITQVEHGPSRRAATDIADAVTGWMTDLGIDPRNPAGSLREDDPAAVCRHCPATIWPIPGGAGRWRDATGSYDCRTGPLELVEPGGEALRVRWHEPIRVHLPTGGLGVVTSIGFSSDTGQDVWAVRPDQGGPLLRLPAAHARVAPGTATRDQDTTRRRRQLEHDSLVAFHANTLAELRRLTNLADRLATRPSPVIDPDGRPTHPRGQVAEFRRCHAQGITVAVRAIAARTGIGYLTGSGPAAGPHPPGVPLDRDRARAWLAEPCPTDPQITNAEAVDVAGPLSEPFGRDNVDFLERVADLVTAADDAHLFGPTVHVAHYLTADREFGGADGVVFGVFLTTPNGTDLRLSSPWCDPGDLLPADHPPGPGAAGTVLDAVARITAGTLTTAYTALGWLTPHPATP